MDIHDWMREHSEFSPMDTSALVKPLPYQRRFIDAATNTVSVEERPMDTRQVMSDLLEFLETNNEFLCLQKAMDEVGCGSFCAMMDMTNAQYLQVVIIENENLLAAGFPSRLSREQFVAVKNAALASPHDKVIPDKPRRLV